MSISRDEFEKGTKKDSLKEEIADFLEKNKDEAFTRTEIAESIGVKINDVNEDWKITMGLFGEFNFYKVLDGLVGENKIIKRKIDSEDYYPI